MGYNRPGQYALQGGIDLATFNDSSNLYLGAVNYQSGTGVSTKLMVPKAGIIRGCVVTWYNITADCTTEDTTLAIVVNATTSETVYTGSFAHSNSPKSKFTMNLSVAQGDYIHLRLTTPAWVTNPQGCYLSFVVFIETA